MILLKLGVKFVTIFGFSRNIFWLPSIAQISDCCKLDRCVFIPSRISISKSTSDYSRKSLSVWKHSKLFCFTAKMQYCIFLEKDTKLSFACNMLICFPCRPEHNSFNFPNISARYSSVESQVILFIGIPPLGIHFSTFSLVS